MRLLTNSLLALTVMVGVIGAPSQADARGIIFYQSGEDIFESGPLPDPWGKVPKLTAFKAGYKCKIFGIFWAYLHTWNCQAVAYSGNKFYRDASMSKAIDDKYKGSYQAGLWKKHGRWLFAVLIIGAIIGGIIGRRKKDEQEETETDEPAAT